MNKKELIQSVSKKSGLSYAKAAMVVNCFISTIKDTIHDVGYFRLAKFGSFKKIDVGPRKYYNIKSKRVTLSKSKRAVKFKSYLHVDKVHEISDLAYPQTDGRTIVMPSINLESYSVSTNSVLISNFSYQVKDNSHATPHTKANKDTPPNHIEFTSFSGNRILPNALNLGKRRVITKEQESTLLEYVGMVNSGFDHSSIVEIENYPVILCPLTGTKILNYQVYRGITGGITEPLLYYALLPLKNIEPEIEILQNISIPIRNRNYGYKPDIAIIWKSKNFYLDIEIDEPYDIESRKPIHFRRCSDAIRNSYLLENGWFVIRFAEEQIVRNLIDCKDLVSSLIAAYLNDTRFNADSKINEITRWTYDEAQKMASENFRESYLGISPKNKCNVNLDTEDDYCTPSDFEFVKPAEDIFDQYNELKECIKKCSANNTHCYIKQKGNGYEYVTSHNLISFIYQDFRSSIKLFDVIENKSHVIPLCDIDSYWGADNIIKDISSNDWREIVYDCIINCNPINISYNKSNQGNITSRTVLYLSGWYQGYNDENRQKHSALALIRAFAVYNLISAFENKHFSHFSGYCLYRQDLRTFATDRIKDGIVYSCFKPATTYENSHMWELLEAGAGDVAEVLYSHLPSTKRNNLVYIGNYCNALVMQGKTGEALKMYLQYNEDEYVPELSHKWSAACFEDIDHFIEKDISKQYFLEMKELLKQNGWKY